MNDLTVVNQSAIMPVMDIQQAVLRRQAIVDFTKRLMVVGTDFGAIPGTTKPTLLKPGAEKLTTLFGLSPRFEIAEKELDWTGDRHNGEAFFYFQYRCSLWRGDLLAGEGVGSCNSWEKKYRWRTASRACPNCGKEAIIKGKEEYGGGWLCFAKKGGCGTKFKEGDPAIVNQEIGQVPNDNPADLVNTLDKMAQKRALVAATLIAVNASEFFTQDVEDMDLSFIEGDYVESNAGGAGDMYPGSPPPIRRAQNTTRKPAPPKAQTNGNGSAETPNEYSMDFLNYCTTSINRYSGNPHAARTALQKQFTAPPAGKAEAKAQFEWLKEHAAQRDAEEIAAAQAGLFDDETVITDGAYSEAHNEA